MREVTIKRKVYSYDELSEEAKDRVKEDYLRSTDREDSVNFYINDVLSTIFPETGTSDSLMNYESSYFSQGSGINLYGVVPFNDLMHMIFLDSYDTNGKWLRKEFPDFVKECEYVQDILGKPGLDITDGFSATDRAEYDTEYLYVRFPKHTKDNYTYSLAQNAYFVDSWQSEEEIDPDDLGEDKNFLAVCLKGICDCLQVLSSELYDKTEDMYLSIPDEEMKALSDENNDEYTSDGVLFIEEEDYEQE